MSRAGSAAPERRDAKRPAYAMPRHFTKAGEDPFEAIAWERRTARILDADGQVVFEQEGVEVPKGWSQLATDLVASRYFSGVPGRPGRESSVRHLVAPDRDGDRRLRARRGRARVGEGRGDLRGGAGLPAAPPARRVQLARLVQRRRRPRSRRPRACFILGLEDRLEAILDLASIEGRIFSKGSGAGTNFSALRGAHETTRTGGFASGPVAFLRGLDALAGAVKSGGRTRRAAKMAILDADHPDILEFVRSKAVEEERARALEAAGLAKGGDVAQDATVAFQNENHSVRVTDAFLEAAERDEPWTLVPRTRSIEPTSMPARALFRAMAEAAHACGDPGLHFADTIDGWNPVARTGPIRASNPCSEFLFLDDTACNLASINLGAFLDAQGEVDVAGLDRRRPRAAPRDGGPGRPGRLPDARPSPATRSACDRSGSASRTSAASCSPAASRTTPTRRGGGPAGSWRSWAARRRLASARLAARLGPFAEWKRNRAGALRVVARHRAAARGLSAAHVPPALRHAAQGAWEAAAKARRGVRPAQRPGHVRRADGHDLVPDGLRHDGHRARAGARTRRRSSSAAAASASSSGACRPRSSGWATTRPSARRSSTTSSGRAISKAHPRCAPATGRCSTRPSPHRPGGRALAPEAHLAMMAAVQPFV